MGHLRTAFALQASERTSSSISRPLGVSVWGRGVTLDLGLDLQVQAGPVLLRRRVEARALGLRLLRPGLGFGLLGEEASRGRARSSWAARQGKCHEGGPSRSCTQARVLRTEPLSEVLVMFESEVLTVHRFCRGPWAASLFWDFLLPSLAEVGWEDRRAGEGPWR